MNVVDEYQKLRSWDKINIIYNILYVIMLYINVIMLYIIYYNVIMLYVV